MRTIQRINASPVIFRAGQISVTFLGITAQGIKDTRSDYENDLEKALTDFGSVTGFAGNLTFTVGAVTSRYFMPSTISQPELWFFRLERTFKIQELEQINQHEQQPDAGGSFSVMFWVAYSTQISNKSSNNFAPDLRSANTEHGGRYPCSDTYSYLEWAGFSSLGFMSPEWTFRHSLPSHLNGNLFIEM